VIFKERAMRHVSRFAGIRGANYLLIVSFLFVGFLGASVFNWAYTNLGSGSIEAHLEMRTKPWGDGVTEEWRDSLAEHFLYRLESGFGKPGVSDESVYLWASSDGIYYLTVKEAFRARDIPTLKEVEGVVSLAHANWSLDMFDQPIVVKFVRTVPISPNFAFHVTFGAMSFLFLWSLFLISVKFAFSRALQ